MIIEPALDKPICLKKEDVLPRVVKEDFERKSEFIFSKPKTKSNIKLNLYFTTTIIFLLGIIIGSIIFRIMVEDIQVQQLVIEKFSTIENTTEKILFQKSFERNIKLLVVYWIVGISVVGAPLLLLLCMYKGFSTAFVISSFLLKYGFVEGNIFIFKNLFLYYLFLILGVILLTASSLKVTVNIFKGKKDIRYELIRHSIFTIIGLAIFLISTLIEVKMMTL